MLFDPLTAAALFTLAAADSGMCRLPAPASIDVTPRSREVRYDYSKSLAQLQDAKIDTISPHSFNGIPITQGYMEGSIKLVPRVELDYSVTHPYRAACIWYDKITIDIEIQPVIVIAKEVREDDCMHEAIKEHEMKHVRVDRRVVNQYASEMARQVEKALKQRGFIAGPVAEESIQDIAGRMQQTVFQIVELEYKKMDIERIEEQRSVDTLEEYERVGAKCPGFYEKIKPGLNAGRGNARKAKRSYSRD